MKTFAYHRVEFSPIDWLHLGLGEMNIIGGKSPDLAQINPFGFWHNTYTSGSSNVMWLFDLSVVPLPGLLVFGEYLADDILWESAELPESKLEWTR